jgi:hypothetical protein
MNVKAGAFSLLIQKSKVVEVLLSIPEKQAVFTLIPPGQ